MPDIWKSEFADNSDWLKFSLHSYSEFPDRPYADSSRKKFLEDYQLLQNEVTRFAGADAFIVPQMLHWNNVSSGVADELIKLGCRCYSESMRPRMMATPPTMLMEIAVCTSRVMFLPSLAPKYCAASTFAPVDNPVITLIINAVIAPVAPIAARLSGLPKQPITTISAA